MKYHSNPFGARIHDTAALSWQIIETETPYNVELTVNQSSPRPINDAPNVCKFYVNICRFAYWNDLIFLICRLLYDHTWSSSRRWWSPPRFGWVLARPEMKIYDVSLFTLPRSGNNSCQYLFLEDISSDGCTSWLRLKCECNGAANCQTNFE